MSSSKFSLIIMHDDGETHRMRMSRYWVQILLILAVILPVVGCFGLWMGFDAWLSMGNWNQERLAYTNQITALNLKLQRLENLEALLADQRKPASVGAPLELAENTQPPNDSNAAVPGGASTTTSPVTTEATQTPQAAAGNTAAPNSVGTALGQATPEGEPEQSDVLINEDSGFRVENLQARLLDRRRLRASIDLYSVEPGQKTLSGRVVFTLITADGQRYPLTNEDPLFRISRFKKIITTSALPVDMEQAENAAIVVEILIDNAITYRNYFSIESK